MKRSIILTVALLCTLTWAKADARVVWDGDFYTFRYGVEENRGTFEHGPTAYFYTENDSEVFSHNPPGSFAPFTAEAFGEVVGFDGSLDRGMIRVRAMAKGPEGGGSPVNGLIVQGFAEILPTGIDANHHQDIRQNVTCWITRRFSVDTAESYVLKADLAGVVNFIDFGDDLPFLGSHFVGGLIEVLENPDDPENIEVVADFPLDEDFRSDEIEITLQTGRVYQLKAVLNITTTVVRWDPSGQSGYPTLPPGPYKVGEMSMPMVVTAIIFDPKILELGLPDAIRILQVLVGLNPAIDDLPSDFSGDGKLGLEEVIYALQNAAELR